MIKLNKKKDIKSSWRKSMQWVRAMSAYDLKVPQVSTFRD